MKNNLIDDQNIYLNKIDDEHLEINFGPQHPSTHGVMRLMVKLKGEIVTDIRCGIGYLHTGIEKNIEYRNWIQGVTFVTRMDYLSPFFNEGVYSASVEKLLNISDKIPERALDIRILCMELNRITSHLIAIGTGGNEIGASTVFMATFRDREMILDIFEEITGLRMNHNYIIPGGISKDINDTILNNIESVIKKLEKNFIHYEKLCNNNKIFISRLKGVGYLSKEHCIKFGMTGPVLRSANVNYDLRKRYPYWTYPKYEFDTVITDTSDSLGRYYIRLYEILESIKIVKQAVKYLYKSSGEPVMVSDKKIAWPSLLSVGNDGIGNDISHIKHIMSSSMEGLIHHFKLVTEGFRVPAGMVDVSFESPRGVLISHVVSNGSTRPYRVHFRTPSFINLQAIKAMCIGGNIGDIVVAVASLDPVMGDVDR